MNYLVKARARLDLKSHWSYIARDNLPAADRLLDAAEETFQLINSFSSQEHDALSGHRPGA